MGKEEGKSADARSIKKGSASGVAKIMKSKQLIAAKGNALHPNSRKAARLHRQVLRADKIAKLKTQGDKKKFKLGERLLWFQDALTPGKRQYTYEEICNLIEQYISRNDEELDAFAQEAAMRGRKVHSGRESLLTATKAAEMEEYRTGFKLPDFRSPKMVKMFNAWQLELNLIPRFNMSIFKQPA